MIGRGELPFGYKTVPQELCLAQDWEGIVDWFAGEGRSLSKARDAQRSIKDFYTLGSDCHWVTFTHGHLYWALLKLIRKLFMRQGYVPDNIVTDKLRSYSAAFRDLGLSDRPVTGGRSNNRAENSHQPLRRRERTA